MAASSATLKPTLESIEVLKTNTNPTPAAAGTPAKDAAASAAPHGRRSVDGWLDRWIVTVGDRARLKAAHPI